MILVCHDGSKPGDPAEPCCFCRTPTFHWCVEKDVAVCSPCSETRRTDEVPSKEDWLADVDRWEREQRYKSRLQAV